MSRSAHSTASPPGRCDVAVLLDTVRAARGSIAHVAAHRAGPGTPPELLAPFLVKLHSARPGETTGLYRVVRARAERANLFGGAA